MVTETRQIIFTSTFNKILAGWEKVIDDGRKIRIFLEGGTNSSKTYSAMQVAVVVLSNWRGNKHWGNGPLLFTVTSESYPHLSTGAMRDFKNILGPDWRDDCWSATRSTYTWPNGCQLEFISGDHPERFSGPRRHGHIFNELNNISQSVYREADLRTSMFVVADWNPYGEFWFHDDELWSEEGTYYYQGLTYKDTPDVVLPDVIKTIESYRDKDPNYYRVHALGLMGKIEGLVYPRFEQVDKLPEGYTVYGLDYGFASDPTALVKCVVIGENLYSQELLYKSGLTNDDIAREMSALKIRREPIMADGNEPKSAEELRRHGFNVQEVNKACMRHNYRIQKVQQYYQFWTKDSSNGIKEQRNYRFIEDKDHKGRFTEKTTHQWSHLMAAREFAVGGAKMTTSGRRGFFRIVGG